jgi:hypothetical protein
MVKCVEMVDARTTCMFLTALAARGRLWRYSVLTRVHASQSVSQTCRNAGKCPEKVRQRPNPAGLARSHCCLRYLCLCSGRPTLCGGVWYALQDAGAGLRRDHFCPLTSRSCDIPASPVRSTRTNHGALHGGVVPKLQLSQSLMAPVAKSHSFDPMHECRPLTER